MNLNIEQNRLETFSKWKIPFIDKNQLALFGFYYYGPADMVKCYFCNIEIGMWEEGDDILTDHLRWSKYCDLICQQPTTNIPINNSLLLQSLPPPPPPDFYLRPSIAAHSDINDINDINDIHDIHEYRTITNDDKKKTNQLMWYNSEFVLESDRVKSYDNGWPVLMSQKPCQLSDAGFYYTGKGDQVICYSCGGGLKDWEQYDDPWEQHAMWYGKCEYVKLMKSDDFIKKMNQKRNCLLTNQSNQNKIENNQIKIDDNDQKMCIVCFENDRNTVFLPCGHVVSCAKCSSSVTKCPACRQSFKKIAKVYF